MKYSESHEWVVIEEEAATVGISDHAQKELGEVVFIQLPSVGDQLQAGQEAVVLESTKAAADIYSPVSGSITAVNTKLNEDPSLLNRSPEEEGWLFKIALDNLDELEPLLERSQYLQLIS